MNENLPKYGVLLNFYEQVKRAFSYSGDLSGEQNTQLLNSLFADVERPDNRVDVPGPVPQEVLDSAGSRDF